TVPLDAEADLTSVFNTYWSEGVAQLNRPWANTNRQPFWSTTNPNQTYNNSFDFFPNDSAMKFGELTYDDSSLISGSGTAAITGLTLGIEISPLDSSYINGTWLSFSTDLTTYSGTATVVNDAVTGIDLTANYTSRGYFGATAIDASGQFTVVGDRFKVKASGYNPILGATFNPSVAWDWTGTILNLVQPPTENADFNGDGTVDATDYPLWRDTLGATGATPYTLGDANGDGQVDPADYQVWKSQFGGPPPAGFASASVRVPEPACMLSAVIAATVLSLSCRVSISGRQRT
ncbi:MAG: dockerin type I domain-containing protein, partial [Pirellulales bacterium]